MFKINKYLRFTRKFPQRGSARNICVDNYECKNPPVPDEWEKHLENLAELRKPLILKKNTCDAAKNVKFYRLLFFFLCVPAIICAALNSYCAEKNRKRLKFVEFEFLRIRRKPFPWDPERTLFHNPRYNALPSGYEEEVPEDEEIDPFDLWRW